jgi:Holliday junction resolvase RusA-like endonuclease
MTRDPISTLHFVADGPPRAKARAGKNGRRSYKDPQTRAYEQHVGMAAHVALVAMGRNRWDMRAAFRLHVDVYLRDRRMPDRSNVVKAVEDGLSGVVYVDDCQIVGSGGEVFLDPERPRVEVTVEMLPAECLIRQPPKRRGRVA